MVTRLWDLMVSLHSAVAAVGDGWDRQVSVPRAAVLMCNVSRRRETPCLARLRSGIVAYTQEKNEHLKRFISV